MDENNYVYSRLIGTNSVGEQSYDHAAVQLAVLLGADYVEYGATNNIDWVRVIEPSFYDNVMYRAIFIGEPDDGRY